ncbi:MAG: AAA family ATPase [Verrucomicrobiota bacterium]
MDLLRHWNLRERPFEATWDTRFFHAGPEHEEALSRLLYLVSETSMNLGLLTGEIGSGKTLTRAVFAGRIDTARFQVLTVENSGFQLEELLGSILRRLDPQIPLNEEGKLARCEIFEQLVRKVNAAGRHLVLLLDEAQDMKPETIHELRWLTNFNGGGASLLTLILIGQPELRNMIVGDAAINQRVSLRFHLKPLRADDMENYLRHRLHVAGHASGSLFTPAAALEIFNATHGIPREVNRLAKLALEQAWVGEAEKVEASAVTAVVRDLERHQLLSPA